MMLMKLIYYAGRGGGETSCERFCHSATTTRQAGAADAREPPDNDGASRSAASAARLATARWRCSRLSGRSRIENKKDTDRRELLLGGGEPPSAAAAYHQRPARPASTTLRPQKR
jgi:hypothetical protein